MTRNRVISYRILDFGDMILFDDIHGLSGRALDGLLGLVFNVIGDADAVRAFVTVASDGTQVTRSTGRKGFTVNTFATVDKNGRGEKGVPKRKDLQLLRRRIEKAVDGLEIRYVAIRAEEMLRAPRVSAP